MNDTKPPNTEFYDVEREEKLKAAMAGLARTFGVDKLEAENRALRQRVAELEQQLATKYWEGVAEENGRLREDNATYRARISETPHQASIPDDIRAAGWMVAVHNDYTHGGEPFTFWGFSRDDRWVKGEGYEDADALERVRQAIGLPSKAVQLVEVNTREVK